MPSPFQATIAWIPSTREANRKSEKLFLLVKWAVKHWCISIHLKIYFLYILSIVFFNHEYNYKAINIECVCCSYFKFSNVKHSCLNNEVSGLNYYYIICRIFDIEQNFTFHYYHTNVCIITHKAINMPAVVCVHYISVSKQHPDHFILKSRPVKFADLLVCIILYNYKVLPGNVRNKRP